MNNYCTQPQAHPDRCGCEPDAFQIARHSKRLVEQQRERIAAIEAKNAALAGANDNLKITISELVDECDQLKAELAAIKGQEPVAIANKGECAFWVSWTDAGKLLRGPGIKLYALPPAAPDVSGLAEALTAIKSETEQ